MHVSERRWRIGEVAKATGMTARAPHHYDDIGLLVPSERSEVGYRLYPADPRLTPLVARWNALIEQFTGGDPGIRASLQKLYETEGPERASRGAVSAETMAYAKRAIEARAG